VLPIWEGTTNVLSLDALLRTELQDGLRALVARVDQRLPLRAIRVSKTRSRWRVTCWNVPRAGSRCPANAMPPGRCTSLRSGRRAGAAARAAHRAGAVVCRTGREWKRDCARAAFRFSAAASDRRSTTRGVACVLQGLKPASRSETGERCPSVVLEVSEHTALTATEQSGTRQQRIHFER